jgi:DNA replication protein DnaC
MDRGWHKARIASRDVLIFREFPQVFQGERMTGALVDRLTHHCHIFEMNGESYRFRESMKAKKSRKSE